MPDAMTLLAAVACAVTAHAALASQAAGNDGCVPAQASEFAGAAAAAERELRRPELKLAQPGRYCLSRDLHQRKLVDPRRGVEMKTIGGDAIVLVGADDVSLDLAGHTLSNARELGYTLVRHYRYDPGRGHFHAFVRTSIRNGSLLSPGIRGIGIRLVSSRTYETQAPASFGTPLRIPQGKEPADVYRDTAHLLEDLLIEAGHRAILLEGSNNVIRNNRIVVDSATAIIAQGPGVVIEGNLIELRGNSRMSSRPARASEAQALFAIRLIQADGAVVRNNEVRLMDGASEGPLPAAVGLVASRDVLVEDNRIQGMQAVVVADADSSYREARNRLQTCRIDGTRYLPPDEAGDSAAAREPACRYAAPR